MRAVGDVTFFWRSDTYTISRDTKLKSTSRRELLYCHSFMAHQEHEAKSVKDLDGARDLRAAGSVTGATSPILPRQQHEVHANCDRADIAGPVGL